MEMYKKVKGKNVRERLFYEKRRRRERGIDYLKGSKVEYEDEEK